MAQPVQQQPQDSHVQPPPQESPMVEQVAQILAAGYSIHITTGALAALLKPLRVLPAAIAMSLGLVEGGTAHRPRVMKGDVRRQAARDDLYFRAAYVLNASQRISKAILSGVPAKQALANERRNYQAHESARRNRLHAAAKVDAAAGQFGPILGWYMNPLLNNDAECIAANGHNFDSRVKPVIGWPGGVHPNCGCVAGPPVPGAGWVDDTTKWHVYRARKVNPKYKLRRAG